MNETKTDGFNKINRANENILKTLLTDKNSNLIREIKGILDTYPCQDYHPFHIPTSKIINRLLNYELIQEKEFFEACESLRYISETRICGILTDEKYLNNIIKLLKADNYPQNLKKIVVFYDYLYISII